MIIVACKLLASGMACLGVIGAGIGIGIIFGILKGSVSKLGRLNGRLEAISLWRNAEEGKRFLDLFYKEKKATLLQGLYQNREAKLRNMRLAINNGN